MRRALPLAVLLAALFVAACDGASPTEVLSGRSPAWSITWGFGMPEQLAPSADGSAWVDFPAAGRGSLNYISAAHERTSPGRTLSASFAIDASPDAAFAAPGDSTPATVGLFLQRRGDDMHSEWGRWWAPRTRVALAGGSFTVSAPLVASQWTAVYGRGDETEFAATLAQLGAIGLTFGGQRAYGHGVALAKGRARFRLLRCEVI